MLIPAAIAALAFIAVHLFIGRLTFLEGKPRHALLSFAGGVAVAYIFLHVLPELAAHQQTFAHELDLSDSAAEAWVYLVSLAGLVVFFGLESAARRSRASAARRSCSCCASRSQTTCARSPPRSAARRSATR